MEGYERVPAPDAWMTEQTITPAQAARLRETAVSITAMKAIRSIIEQADSRREPIRQVDGDKINEDKLIERGQPT